jgi:hypothetical protein
VPFGASVLVTTPSGFTYSYINTGFDPSNTVVNSGFTGSSIVGIGYFTTNSFFIEGTLRFPARELVSVLGVGRWRIEIDGLEQRAAGAADFVLFVVLHQEQ